ncbi:MAG: MerR family transcriptional regulator [Chloroflexota bacterium]
MKELTIGEVARYAGIQTSAIRYYEREGLLPPPKRVNGHRRYDPDVLKRLGLIQLVRQAGFGIRELQILFSGLDKDSPASTQWQTLAAEKIAEMDALIKRTQATKAWLVEALQSECAGAEDCVTIAFDESVGGMKITLSCEIPKSNTTSEMRKAMKLMTMSLPINN